MVDADDTGVLTSIFDAEAVSATLLVAEFIAEGVAPELVARLEPPLSIPEAVLEIETSAERSTLGVETETLAEAAETEASSEYETVDVE